MKTNFTSARYGLFLVAILFCSTHAKSQNPLFYFDATPTLISGTELTIGAKYKFDNVAAGTNAVVTIVGATGGAEVVILDDNTLTKPEAFSPQVSVPANLTGMVEFKIEFFDAALNTLKNMPEVIATAMDIDGSNNVLYERDAINMGGGVLTYQSSPLEILVTKSGTEFLGVNIAGLEYPGVDTTSKQVMFTVGNNNISSFTYKAGAMNLQSSLIKRQKGLYFKSFDYINIVILPVKYFSFTAAVINNNVNLKWVTEQENTNNRFEAERSFDGDNFNFTGIVTNGYNAAGKKNYQLIDNAPELIGKTVVYYRLKYIDNNGKATYSNTISVKLQANAGVAIQTWPNPFIENVNVSFSAVENGIAEVIILNGNGQKILYKQTSSSKGYNTLQVNGLSNLAPGMYIAHVKINGVFAGTQKIMKN
jgi:Secretion system C-terminal sorting domain